MTFRAVLKGDFLGIPAAAERIECPIIYITRFSESRFREMWLDWNAQFTVAQQLRTS